MLQVLTLWLDLRSANAGRSKGRHTRKLETGSHILEKLLKGNTMSNNTYNGYQSYDHWNTALWFNNEEQFYNLLQNKVELAVYIVCSREQAIHEILRSLPELTPDGATWQADTIEDLFDESYQAQIQYS